MIPGTKMMGSVLVTHTLMTTGPSSPCRRVQAKYQRAVGLRNGVRDAFCYGMVMVQ